MTSRLKARIASAACAALFAIASADVALAQQGCFMDCNRAPDKPVGVSSDLTSPEQTGTPKQPATKHHARKAHAERERRAVKP
jgi:hypothetical protein